MCTLETPHFLFVDRLKSTHWSDSNQNYETGSHHSQITGFFPLLSRSALYFRYSAICLHTRQLKSNNKVHRTIDQQAQASKLQRSKTCRMSKPPVSSPEGSISPERLENSSFFSDRTKSRERQKEARQREKLGVQIRKCF